MSESTNNYTVQKKGIYYTVGQYRLDNRLDAEKLCKELNQKDNVRQLTAVLMDLEVVKHDVEELKKAIQ